MNSALYRITLYLTKQLALLACESMEQSDLAAQESIRSVHGKILELNIAYNIAQKLNPSRNLGWELTLVEVKLLDLIVEKAPLAEINELLESSIERLKEL